MPYPMTARQIADDLASRITAGEYQPGAQLHYGELAELYGVSRAVIKRAVGLLRFRGLAVDWQGRGVFVPHSNGGPTPPKPEPE